MSSAQIICIQVVPDFAGVLMMMSPARAENRCQRLLSATADRYRTTAPLVTHPACLLGNFVASARVAGRRVRTVRARCCLWVVNAIAGTLWQEPLERAGEFPAWLLTTIRRRDGCHWRCLHGHWTRTHTGPHASVRSVSLYFREAKKIPLRANSRRWGASLVSMPALTRLSCSPSTSSARKPK